MDGWSYQCEVGKKLTLNDDLGGKMAKFFEYQGKEIFKQSGIPIPEGMVANSPQEARQAAERLARPVVVKAQVWAGGRGKSGAVKFADTPGEAEAAAKAILGMHVKGLEARIGSISRARAARSNWVGVGSSGSCLVKMLCRSL